MTLPTCDKHDLQQHSLALLLSRCVALGGRGSPRAAPRPSRGGDPGEATERGRARGEGCFTSPLPSPVPSHPTRDLAALAALGTPKGEGTRAPRALGTPSAPWDVWDGGGPWQGRAPGHHLRVSTASEGLGGPPPVSPPRVTSRVTPAAASSVSRSLPRAQSPRPEPPGRPRAAGTGPGQVGHGQVPAAPGEARPCGNRAQPCGLGCRR